MHGSFNNSLPTHLPSKKNLDSLSSIYDIDLFQLNTVEVFNPKNSLYNHFIKYRYYSQHSCHKFKIELPKLVSDSTFAILPNNVRSLKSNIENFQVHLPDELDFKLPLQEFQ